MAPERTEAGINYEPVINLAHLLHERHNITFPAPINKIAQSYANVAWENIPFDIDGLCIKGRISGQKPKIYINTRRRNAARQRFTLAHELGHAVIPWHIGLFFDQDTDGDDASFNIYTFESEANEFAAELLAPKELTKGIIESTPFVSDALEQVRRQFDLSHYATIVGFLRCLPHGHIIAQIDDGRVKRAWRSAGTIASQPRVGECITDPSLMYQNSSFEKLRFCSLDTIIWCLDPSVSLSSSNNESRNSREILGDLVRELGLGNVEEQDFRRSMNGIIGYAAGRREVETSGEIKSAIIQRLEARKIWHTLRNCRSIDAYLDTRIMEILRKRGRASPTCA